MGPHEKPVELEIKAEGPWQRDAEGEKTFDAVLKSFELREVCHV